MTDTKFSRGKDFERLLKEERQRGEAKENQERERSSVREKLKEISKFGQEKTRTEGRREPAM